MKWMLAALAAACLIGLVLLVRAVRSDGGDETAGSSTTATATAVGERAIAEPAATANPPPRPPPSGGRETDGEEPVEVQAPEEAEPDPLANEITAAADIAERIEHEDAPRELRRLAMQCEREGQPLQGSVYVAVTLASGGGQVRVDQVSIKDNLLDPDLLTCMRGRLAGATWAQPDAPDRRWRVGISLAFTDEEPPLPERVRQLNPR